MDESLRIQLEGYRPGKYIRLEIKGVPCEMVTNFNPAYPIVIGGVQVIIRYNFNNDASVLINICLVWRRSNRICTITFEEAPLVPKDPQEQGSTHCLFGLETVSNDSHLLCSGTPITHF
jgi:hypothetical protein